MPYQCEACRKTISKTDPTHPYDAYDTMHQNGLFYVIQTRSGKIISYCSLQCLLNHYHAGKGSPYYYGFRHEPQKCTACAIALASLYIRELK